MFDGFRSHRDEPQVRVPSQGERTLALIAYEADRLLSPGSERANSFASGQDRFGSCDLGEGTGVRYVLFHSGVDLARQFLDAGERTAAGGLRCDEPEPALDLIDLGGIGRGVAQEGRGPAGRRHLDYRPPPDRSPGRAQMVLQPPEGVLLPSQRRQYPRYQLRRRDRLDHVVVRLRTLSAAGQAPSAAGSVGESDHGRHSDLYVLKPIICT